MRVLLAAVIQFLVVNQVFGGEQSRLEWDAVDRARLVESANRTVEIPLFIQDVLDAATANDSAPTCFSFYMNPVSNVELPTPDGEEWSYIGSVSVAWFPAMDDLRAAEMNGGPVGVLLGRYCAI